MLNAVTNTPILPTVLLPVSVKNKRSRSEMATTDGSAARHDDDDDHSDDVTTPGDRHHGGSDVAGSDHPSQDRQVLQQSVINTHELSMDEKGKIFKSWLDAREERKRRTTKLHRNHSSDENEEEDEQVGG